MSRRMLCVAFSYRPVSTAYDWFDRNKPVVISLPFEEKVLTCYVHGLKDLGIGRGYSFSILSIGCHINTLRNCYVGRATTQIFSALATTCNKGKYLLAWWPFSDNPEKPWWSLLKNLVMVCTYVKDWPLLRLTLPICLLCSTAGIRFVYFSHKDANSSKGRYSCDIFHCFQIFYFHNCCVSNPPCTNYSICRENGAWNGMELSYFISSRLSGN